MNAHDLSGAPWRKSRHSNGQASCVEVAITGQGVAVRDTKDRPGPVLCFTPATWTAFTTSIKTDTFGQRLADS
jgi:Domain of unknown function (DUF397)